MANIVYSVQGVGWGHIIRSEVVIKYLESKGHNVFVGASNKAFDYYQTKFSHVFPLKGVNYTFKNSGCLNKTKLTYDLITGLPRYVTYNLRNFFKNLFPEKLDLVITDFEPTAQIIAFLLDLPFVSIDNIHILLHPGISILRTYKSDFKQAKLLIKNVARGADYYLVCAWDKTLKGSDNFLFVPPILRQEVIKTEPSHKDHILVYQWAEFIDKTVDVLLSFPKQEFIVYGSSQNKKFKNIELKAFSDSGIIKDLASSKAVITSGGFTLCSEALHFKKPVLVLPQGGQFEQIYNGLVISELGYGKIINKLSTVSLNEFLVKIPKASKRLQNYITEDNSVFFKVLDETINKLTN